jgi:hypothetical protein
MYYVGRNKKHALSALLLHGGAMNYDDGAFFVGTHEEVAEIICGGNVKDATERALSMATTDGGLISCLMDGWGQDDAEEDAEYEEVDSI